MAVFTGTNGNDTLPAVGQDNSGDDQFLPLLGSDTVDGGAGFDTLTVDYTATGQSANAEVRVTLDGQIFGGFGNAGYPPSSDVQFSNVEKLVLTTYLVSSVDDGAALNLRSESPIELSLVGNTATLGQSRFQNFQYFYIDSGAGDDKITTGNFNDRVVAGAGKNTVNAGAGDDMIDTRKGIGIVDGGAGFDTWFGDVSTISTGITLNWAGPKDVSFSDGNIAKNIEAIGLRLGSGNDAITTTGGQLQVQDTSRVDNDSLMIDYRLSGVGVGGEFNLWEGTSFIGESRGSNSFMSYQLEFFGFENVNARLSQLSDHISFRAPIQTFILPVPGEPPPTPPTPINSVINAEGGSDTLTYKGLNSSLNAPGINFKVSGTTATDGFASFLNFENYVVGGSRSNDTIVTGEGDDRIVPSRSFNSTIEINIGEAGGYDTISTGGGNDHIGYAGGKIDAGSGDDIVQHVSSPFDAFGAPNSIVDGGLGFDYWSGELARGTAFSWDGVSDVTLSDGTVLKNFERLDLTTSIGDDSVTVRNLGISGWSDASGPFEDPADNDTLVLDYSEIGAAGVEISVYSRGVSARLTGKPTGFFGSGIENFDIRSGSGKDYFSYVPTAKSIKLDAGGGEDTLRLDGNLSIPLEFFFDGAKVISSVGGTFLNFEAFAINDSSGNDSIVTGAGDDSITSFEGSDEIDSGSGNDMIRIAAYNTRLLGVQINGGEGQDVLNLNDYDRTVFEFEFAGPSQMRFKNIGENSVGTWHTASNIEKVQFRDNIYLVKNGALEPASTNTTPPAPGIKITGTAKNDTISPTSTKKASTAADDTISTLAGNDSIDGGAGGDTMKGGADNDTYFVDNTRDKTVEKLNEGTDKVFSSINWTLSANTENLVLQNAALSGVGNKLANKITGNANDNTLSGMGGNDKLKGDAGADTLSGGAGNDILIGGADADTFHFDKAAMSTWDTIKDFAHGIDTLEFAGSFYGVAAGPLATDMLQLGTKATLGHAQFLFNAKTQELSWDANGKAGGEIKIAKLAGVTLLTVDDVSII